MFVEAGAFEPDPGVPLNPAHLQGEIPVDATGQTDYMTDQSSGDAAWQAVLNLGAVSVESGLLTSRQKGLFDVIPATASLLESEQAAGERLPADAIIDALRGPVPVIDRADRLARARQRLRPVVDRVVSSQFDRRVEKARRRIDALKPNTVAAIERHIAALAGTENLGEEITEEITRLDDEIRQETEMVRSKRVAANLRPEALVPLPGGIKGAALRVFRAVRNFFRPKSRSEVNPQQATAYDFAVAMHRTVDKKLSAGGYPILSTFAGYVQKLPLQAIAGLAPEFMAAFASVKKKNINDPLPEDPLRTSIQNNPYEFRSPVKWSIRWVAGRSRHLASRGFGFEHLQYASENLLPALTGALRTVSGDQIRTLKDRADGLLRQPRPERQQAVPLEHQPYVRNPFRRRRETESVESRPRRPRNSFRRRNTEVIEPRLRSRRLRTVSITPRLPQLRRRRRRQASGSPETP